MPVQTTAQVDERVLAGGEPVVYVAHDARGGWLVAGPGFTDRPLATFRPTPLGELGAIDASLRDVLDLAAGWHAFRGDADEAWASVPMPEGDMYLMSFELRPAPSNEKWDAIGGALVNCWVKRPSVEAAVAAAREHLADSGWVILSEGQPRLVTLAAVGEESTTYFRQAEIDGEVFVIYSFPPEEPDA